MAVKIQVEVFWVVTLCIDAIGYQCFGGPCCLHLHLDFDLTLNMEAAWSSKMLVSSCRKAWCNNPEDLNFKDISFISRHLNNVRVHCFQSLL